MTSNNHVEAEVLAAWSEGRLSARESTAVEAHLASCDECQDVLGVFARTAPPLAGSGVPGLSRMTRNPTWHLRWAIPIAAAATVAAIWVAIPPSKRTAELQHNDALSVPASAPQAAADDDAPVATEPRARAEAKQESPRSNASAPPSLTDRAEQEKLDKVERRDTSVPAAPPRAQEQDRFRVEERAELIRQAPAPDVVSPDPLVRWRIQPPGRLERSINAGKTWDPVTLPQPISVTIVQAPSANTAIVTAADGRQFRTEDQGKTWNLVQP